MEQRLIDANLLCKRLRQKPPIGEVGKVTLDECIEEVNYADTVNAITIPDNVTNGDMIKAMFPNLKVEENVEFEPNFVKIHPYNDDCFIYFTKELWNSPYKKGE